MLNVMDVGWSELFLSLSRLGTSDSDYTIQNAYIG
jgi:hypothetical protein